MVLTLRQHNTHSFIFRSLFEENKGNLGNIHRKYVGRIRCSIGVIPVVNIVFFAFHIVQEILPVALAR